MMLHMRTTLTLDDDLAEELRRIAYERGEPFKRVVNEALRAGLAAARMPQRATKYRLEPADMGALRPGVNLDKALLLAEELEDVVVSDEIRARK